MDTKPLPPATGLVVLPEPVVPEYIIVHAGRPEDSSAPNHWVPFRDYIKNVASSEIYANWPQQTIVANVLAIISFTLNRVYTVICGKGKPKKPATFFNGLHTFKSYQIIINLLDDHQPQF